MIEKTKIKNRERARKWYQDNRQRKLDYERERLNKGKVLQDRIDRAIKYMEDNREEHLLQYGDGIVFEEIEQFDNLLNILKGSDNK